MDVRRLIQSLEAAPIGDGDLIGEPFEVLPYQARFLRGAFRPGVLRAGLSLGRGGGKTGLAAAMALDSIRPDGVLHRRGFECILIASSFGQARIAYEAVLESLRLLGEAGAYRIRDQQNLADIQHRETKARLRVAGSDNKRAHGWRFNLAIGDEPSQWGARGELLASAIRTGLGKRKEARAVFIGTRPANDSHFFARLLEDPDLSSYAQVHSAPIDAPPLQVRTWRQANPGLRYGLPDVEVLRAEARLARRDPAELASFRAMRLNQGTPETESQTLVDATAWVECEARSLPPRAGPFCLGLDLGQTAAFSAAAAYWPETGRLEGFVACGNDPPLAERALGDGVSGVYQRMLAAGELVLLGWRVVPVDLLLQECTERYGIPQALAADRFKQGELEDGVRAAGLRMPEPTWRGMGYRDGSEDVRAFRAAVLERKVRPPVSLAMRSAFGEARVISDPAGNSKLAKAGEGQRRRRGRDDLAAAIVLSVAEGARRSAKPKRPPWRYAGMAG